MKNPKKTKESGWLSFSILFHWWSCSGRPAGGKFQPAEDKGVHYFFRQLKTAALPNFCKGQAGTSSVVALLETKIILSSFEGTFESMIFLVPI